jgi:hypothetical protein
MNKPTKELCIAIMRTNSAKEYKALVLKYILETKDIDVEELVIFADNLIIEKTNQGKQSAAKRMYGKELKENVYKGPAFFSDNKNEFVCQSCNKVIKSNYCFKHKVNGIYLYWCALPGCLTEEMKQNKKYLTTMRPEIRALRSVK